MARPMLPLSGFRTFECAARHLSFARAAEELRLTPAAVSHQVRTLEDYVGVRLFNRDGRRLTLTDAGEGQAVLDLRRRWQRVMEADVSREIEELTGRKVVGCRSDNHIDPDLAVEVFVLEPLA